MRIAISQDTKKGVKLQVFRKPLLFLCYEVYSVADRLQGNHVLVAQIDYLVGQIYYCGPLLTRTMPTTYSDFANLQALLYTFLGVKHSANHRGKSF